MTTGIEYKKTGHYGRNIVLGYHQSPAPEMLNKGAKNSDVANFKNAERKNLVQDITGDHECKFTIGMEVEKNRFNRGAVTEYPLFKGFERDASCGYEAITNVLPLLPKSTWRNKVFNMMHEAKRIIEDSYSPSNHKCGGHVTLAVQGMTGAELRDAMKPFAGIIYALFRKRLDNGYCRENLFLNEDQDHRSRYQVCLVKDDRIEWRVVSRFQSVKQMMRRYELFYELVDLAVNNPNAKFSTALSRVRPVVMSMYGHDETKVNEIFEIAKAMQKMINQGRINRETLPFADPHGRYARHAEHYYDRDLQTNGHRQW